MTLAQHKKVYMPAWGVAVRANNWRMKDCRLICNPAQNRALGECHHDLWDIAERLADEANRAVTPDDLRHAANYLATNGRTASSKTLTSPELDRFQDLCGVLAAPDSLEAMRRWVNPEIRQRESAISYIEYLSEKSGAAEAISANAFGTRDWRELPLDKLTWLNAKLRGRR